jgi:hypothetical protein
MKIKHWQGYGTVSATRIKDKSCTLHVRVTGNHEWGLRRDNLSDLYNWLVRRFDKSAPDVYEFLRSANVFINEGFAVSNGLDVDTCDYYFTY